MHRVVQDADDKMAMARQGMRTLDPTVECISSVLILPEFICIFQVVVDIYVAGGDFISSLTSKDSSRTSYEGSYSMRLQTPAQSRS